MAEGVEVKRHNGDSFFVYSEPLDKETLVWLDEIKGIRYTPPDIGDLIATLCWLPWVLVGYLWEGWNGEVST